MLKLAAIDIGSNAIRIQLTRVTLYQGNTTFKRLEYVRFPLRLGHDVFTTGKISGQSQTKFLKLMHAFKILIDLYEVDDYMGCATSAMREAENGRPLIDQVKAELDLEIKIIDGDKEAFMINKAIFPYMDEKAYLHIDVGGGSTEFNFYQNNEKLLSKSFQIGSVRHLETDSSHHMWSEMKNWIEQKVLKKSVKIHAIGTGGNINKVQDLAKKKPGKPISLKKVIETQAYIKSFDMEERINKLQLNPDRADVIIPALDIYINAMRWSKSASIIVPDTGLKDGIMQVLYERNKEKFQ
ncbi:exopolyphosphatase / guanosine-5'-triphosphate,3'-diphosphate pyrophosphatase [Marivirga sericea]|uniref:Exopolyphosphatase / guanosine-5'-triphosphate,3'-diphosphate pyrophosphatase n=1 Tax=Marivirga sericea TaxID=1028 RepID=A0A1X7JMF7_9BACT|nr:phosphatase [Marivirga sericea]SMG28608.1 exopolyphosphatase / guanosine-5'-triphosphate,3'-diphosphate pyrophosphatase [Marivirga sericea]